MTTDAPPKVQPALLGGLFVGILSALPIVSAANLCCCLWVVGGGILAAYLMQQNYPAPVTLGDGAAVGLLAGIFGALVHTVAAIPLTLLTAPFQRDMIERFLQTAEDIPPEMRGLIQDVSTGIVGIIVGLLFMVLAGVIFGTLGGFVGALIFRRQPPPIEHVPTSNVPPL